MNNPHTDKMVLSIAGSDPSGGAGIQADLKTFCVAGVYSGAVITCLTVQNTRGVTAYEPVAPELVKEQIRSVLEDMPVSHIKTGMIGTAGIAAGIGEALKDFPGEIICDPVLAATGGQPLLDLEAREAFLEHIAGRATVLTPNIPELEILFNERCTCAEEIIRAGNRVLEQFPGLRAVIVKGGHLPVSDQVTDYMVGRGEGSGENTVIAESHPYINSENTHGTGCTFASAFTAFHLRSGGDDQAAFRQAVSFMDQLLTCSVSHSLGSGKGPLMHHIIQS